MDKAGIGGRYCYDRPSRKKNEQDYYVYVQSQRILGSVSPGDTEDLTIQLNPQETAKIVSVDMQCRFAITGGAIAVIPNEFVHAYMQPSAANINDPRVIDLELQGLGGTTIPLSLLETIVLDKYGPTYFEDKVLAAGTQFVARWFMDNLVIFSGSSLPAVTQIVVDWSIRLRQAI